MVRRAHSSDPGRVAQPQPRQAIQQKHRRSLICPSLRHKESEYHPAETLEICNLPCPRLPMGYYAKGLDGRIDNPNGGWKGKGIYTPVSTRAPFHMEGGKGVPPKLVKFQMRPDPLAN